jgi:hypothetical protein
MPLASSLLNAGGFQLPAFASAGLLAVAIGQAQTSVNVKLEAAMIHLAAGALGGGASDLALRTLIIEGAGQIPTSDRTATPTIHCRAGR